MPSRPRGRWGSTAAQAEPRRSLQLPTAPQGPATPALAAPAMPVHPVPLPCWMLQQEREPWPRAEPCAELAAACGCGRALVPAGAHRCAVSPRSCPGTAPAPACSRVHECPAARHECSQAARAGRVQGPSSTAQARQLLEAAGEGPAPALGRQRGLVGRAGRSWVPGCLGPASAPGCQLGWCKGRSVEVTDSSFQPCSRLPEMLPGVSQHLPLPAPISSPLPSAVCPAARGSLCREGRVCQGGLCIRGSARALLSARLISRHPERCAGSLRPVKRSSWKRGCFAAEASPAGGR